MSISAFTIKHSVDGPFAEQNTVCDAFLGDWAGVVYQVMGYSLSKTRLIKFGVSSHGGFAEQTAVGEDQPSTAPLGVQSSPIFGLGEPEA